MMYFILGSHPDLSVAEILAVVHGDVVAKTQEVLVMEGVAQTAAALQERLAGTVKVGEIIGEFEAFDREQAAELIAAYAREAVGKNKIRFGVSWYGFDRADAEIGTHAKKLLKQTERPVRFVTSKTPALSSVVVHENGLLESGGEYVFLRLQGRVLVGQTQAVQDYKAWSARDFGRPARDAASGMLPPKLARMMINLSGVPPQGHTLLDPFCGSGTVLGEAALLGFAKVIGSDLSEKAIEGARQNLGILHTDADVQMFVQDVRSIEEAVTEPVDVIVTETFLGTPRARPLQPTEFDAQRADLMELYRPALSALHAVLKPGGRCVFAAPFFQTTAGERHLELASVFKNVGFEGKPPLFYRRAGQIVGREIFVLSKA